MKKLFFIFCMVLSLALCSFVNAEAATKKVIEKDAQGNPIKTTITETDQYGNETTTIINHQEEVKPQPQQQIITPAVSNEAQQQQLSTNTNVQQQTVVNTAQPQENVSATPNKTAVITKKGLKPGSNLLYGRLGLSIPTNKLMVKSIYQAMNR